MTDSEILILLFLTVAAATTLLAVDGTLATIADFGVF
jgi:hypothetical protein